MKTKIAMALSAVSLLALMPVAQVYADPMMHPAPYDQYAAASQPDRQMQKVLDSLASLNGQPIDKLSAADARQQPSAADAVNNLLRQEGKDPQKIADALNVETRDITYPSTDGSLPARIYRPIGSAKEMLPVIVYYHGGGWVLADINTYDSSARALSHMAHAVVVSIEYRHAPENKFPAAWLDAFAGYQYVLANAQTFGGDPNRVAVAGESAGGNLAVNVAIMARDQGVQMPKAIAAIYPVAGTDLNTPSYQGNANAKPLSRAGMEWFFKQTANRKSDLSNPKLNLVGADLHDLPPTTIVTASIDPLQSDGKMLADRMVAAGDRVDYQNYDGVTHEFFGMAAVVDKAKKAEMLVADDLKATLGGEQHHHHHMLFF